jgi:hypothetical protein
LYGCKGCLLIKAEPMPKNFLTVCANQEYLNRKIKFAFGLELNAPHNRFAMETEVRLLGLTLLIFSKRVVFALG